MKRLIFPLLTLFVFVLAACGGQPAAEAPVAGQVEVEVTRLVEVEVTRLVEIEVTRLVETTSEVVVTATPLPTDEPPPTPEIDPSAYIAGGNMSPDDLPQGEEGLVVVLVGPPSRFGAVPVVVRNNTAAPAYGIELSATARDAAGSVIGTGPGRDFAPYYVAPGGIAFGRILFEDTPLDSATFEYALTAADEPGTIFTKRDMEVIEHNLVGGNVVGMLANNNESALDLTQAIVMCFDDSLTPTTLRDSFTDQDRVEGGAQLPFSVDLLGDESLCGRYLVAGQGWEAD